MVPPAGVGEEGDLARKAIALAQVEDDHPLPGPGVPGIGCAVLDTHSVVAVSSQGAARLYAEQSALRGEEVHEFNQQLLHRGMNPPRPSGDRGRIFPQSPRHCA